MLGWFLTLLKDGWAAWVEEPRAKRRRYSDMLFRRFVLEHWPRIKHLPPLPNGQADVIRHRFTVALRRAILQADRDNRYALKQYLWAVGRLDDAEFWLAAANEPPQQTMARMREVLPHLR